MPTHDAPAAPAEFESRLRAIGEAAYHDKHPFHVLMHGGKLTKRQLQAWIENRFYYQCMIPKKDAAILAKADDADFRRAWITRIVDHDGRVERAAAALTTKCHILWSLLDSVYFAYVAPGWLPPLIDRAVSDE